MPKTKRRTSSTWTLGLYHSLTLRRSVSSSPCPQSKRLLLADRCSRRTEDAMRECPKPSPTRFLAFPGPPAAAGGLGTSCPQSAQNRMVFLEQHGKEALSRS